jgi:hypothetical protein
MRIHHVAGIVLTGLVPSAIGPSRPAAADNTDRLNPPLVGMTEHRDKAGVLSIRLPVTWSEEKADRGPTHLAKWTGWYQKKTAQTPHPDQLIFVDFERAYRHAELVRHFDTGKKGTLVEGSLERGDGWVQIQRRDESEESHYTVRYIEAPGGVLVVVFKNSIKFQQYIHGHTAAVIDTLRVIGEVPDPLLPEGYLAVHGEGVEIWTNGKSSNAIKKAVRAYKEGWNLAKSLCDGKRVAREPPRMVFCKDQETYRDLFEHATGGRQAIPFGFPDRDRWAVVMLLKDANKKDFPLWARRWGALQYVRRHFGGMLPAWIEWGLCQRPALEGKRGKLVKPHRSDIGYAKKGAKKRRLSFDELMGLTMNEITSDTDQLQYEVWAWHYWFQEVADGELAGVAYRDYLEELRESGNIEEAEKAFDGIGKDAITALFHAWLEGWK